MVQRLTVCTPQPTAAAHRIATQPRSSSNGIRATFQQQRWRQLRAGGRAAQRSVMTRAESAPAPAAVRYQASPEVLTAIQTADAFCFDVDSTFCTDESIDELAAFLGVGEKVAALTSQAMGGTVLFQDSLATRLDAMQVSASALDSYLASHPPQLSPGIPELVRHLHECEKSVYLVSGGFRQIIHPIAEQLHIPLTHVFANTLLFAEDGSYAGFDAHEFTSRSGGKREAVAYVKQRDSLRSVVMVGDGATDAEARAPGAAGLFVCYGGVVLREVVATRADWTITDIHQLLDVVRKTEHLS